MRSAPAAELVGFRRIETPLGRWLVAEGARGAVYVDIAAGAEVERLRDWARAWAPGARIAEGELDGRAAEQLAQYARGERRSFDVTLDPRGSELELAVWHALRSIPFGGTETYGALASRIGRPGAGRAVGTAAGRNPLPILVPCHRLVASSGPGGFSAGLELKRALLAHEAVSVVPGPSGQPARAAHPNS